MYVGDLTDVLSTHWACEVNEKTHPFWANRQLLARLEETFAVAGIAVETVAEGETSSVCPHCGEEDLQRCGDTVHCSACGLEAHADVVGAGNILAGETDTDITDVFRPMARPAAPDPGRAWDGDRTVTYLQWDDHEWSPTRTVRAGTLGSLDQRGVSTRKFTRRGREKSEISRSPKIRRIFEDDDWLRRPRRNPRALARGGCQGRHNAL